MELITAPIVEIFRSLEGEGEFIGTPTIFIRLAGCNVGCKFCDSKLTWNQSKYLQRTVDQVLWTVNSLRKGAMVNRISITGGEPLLHEEFLLQLCDALILTSNFYKLNLETSGTLFPSEIFSPGATTDYFDTISMDIKTPSSGVDLSLDQIEKLRAFSTKKNIYTKAVIATMKDLEFVLDVFKDVKVNNLILTPCEHRGQFFSVDKIYKVLDKRGVNLNTFPLRIIAQQHKLLRFR